jgi:dTDP-4-dehydrorhamnose 3,5-epimerase
MGKILMHLENQIDGTILNSLKIIDHPSGDIFHAMKDDDLGYSGFGEAYFSTIKYNSIKAWKRHRKMTLNLIVPQGEVCFVIYDDRLNSKSNGTFQKVSLSTKNYLRLTIPPMLWVGFQGVNKGSNIVLNIADIKHQPDESDRLDINKIKYDWELKK